MSSKTEPHTEDTIVDILMYHSISDSGGPTSIHPSVFKAHMDAIEEAEVPVITLDDYLAARNGEKVLAPHSIIITFDDGFVDFAEEAYPVLKSKGFDAIVYLPTGCLGGEENWRGCNAPARKLMGWAQVKELHQDGALFGSHTVHHPDLDSLITVDLIEELRASRIELEDKLGTEIRHFAPPYGVADHFARTTIERLYHTSVGTIFERATLESDIVDLPRLEMFYYASPERWRRHVQGKGEGYMMTRRAMRKARGVVAKPWDRA